MDKGVDAFLEHGSVGRMVPGKFGVDPIEELLLLHERENERHPAMKRLTVPVHGAAGNEPPVLVPDGAKGETDLFKVVCRHGTQDGRPCPTCAFKERV